MVTFGAGRRMINVLFFGPITMLTNRRKWQLPYIHGITLREALISVEQRFPGVMNIVRFIAVNEIHTHDYNLSFIPCWFKTPAFRPAGAPNPALKDGVLKARSGRGCTPLPD